MIAIVSASHDPIPAGRWAALAVLSVCALFATDSNSFAHERPVLRGGLWEFDRTLETNGKVTNRLQTSGLSIDRHMTRCVNPTRALDAELGRRRGGFCNIKDLHEKDGGYEFEKFCGGGTPIRTTIDVKGDGAYTEVNEGRIGKIASKETIDARRVGDCHRT